MAEQTPIKCIALSGVQIFTVDEANIAYLQCVASSPDNARWLAWSLGQAHNVEVIPAGGILTMKLDDSQTGMGARPELKHIPPYEVEETAPVEPDREL